jgi:hypothetical protein
VNPLTLLATPAPESAEIPQLPGRPLTPGEPFTVQLYRPQFDDFFTLIMPDGLTEELDTEETKEWFRVRGADPIQVEKSMDYAWNFCTGPKSTYTCAVRIAHPKLPPSPHGKLTPKL